MEIPTGHVSPHCIGTRDNPNLYLDQPITKAWCQTFGGHISYPTGSPATSRLGVCSSLIIVWLSQRQSINREVYMMTSSNGNIFRVTGHLCGEFTGPRWIPRTKASDAELWCFFHLRLNKRLSKQSQGWWFETLSHPLWRQCNMSKIKPYQIKARQSANRVHISWDVVYGD